MLRRILLVVAAVCFTCLVALDGAAAPRDKAALKKIEEAIFTHFLNTDFDTAEGLLLGTIRACEDKCSPEVKAKAWMYIGVVRGAGRNDIPGAEEAFRNAKGLDPNVQLDAQVASDDVKAAFARVAGGGGGGGDEPAPAASGEMKCSLTSDEVQSRRQIPIACESETDLEGAKLYYQTFNASDWSSVDMEPVDGIWQGTIPCTATQSTGTLKWYVSGFDADGEVVDQLGDDAAWNEVEIVEETSAEPPAFPEAEPPARCSVTVAKPGGKCGGWGEVCGAGDCCDAGLTCVSGTCEPSQCESDADCDEGKSCEGGRCRGEGSGSGEAKKNWVGLHFGFDITSLSADGACTTSGRDENFSCYQNGNTYPPSGRAVNQNAGGNITGGFVPSTMRVMASYERLFGPIGLEARVGFAFNGGRTPEGGSAFLPVHAELRGKFWILGSAAFEKPGIRPYIHLGGGLAQVDATVKLDVRECDAGDTTCINSADPVPPGSTTVNDVEVTRALGQSFVTAGGGLMYGIGQSHGPVLNVNAMFMFPSSGLVLEPSLGYAIGF